METLVKLIAPSKISDASVRGHENLRQSVSKSRKRATPSHSVSNIPVSEKSEDKTSYKKQKQPNLEKEKEASEKRTPRLSKPNDSENRDVMSSLENSALLNGKSMENSSSIVGEFSR